MNRHSKHQIGAVLVVSLIMLLLLTIIGAVGMQTTSLEEKMTSSQRDRNLAFQSAESALRAGETFLTQATLPNFNNTNGLYSQTGTPPGANDDWGSSSFSTVSYSYDSSIAANPRYVIQRLANIESGSSLDAASYGQSEMYTVIARGVGGTNNAVVVLQSYYKR